MKFLQVIKKKLSTSHSQMGFSLIELLITIGLITIFLPALLIGFSATRDGRPQMEQRLKATQFVREGEEAVRVVRESDWTAFSANGTFHPEKIGNTWKLLQYAKDPSPGFHRALTIEDVSRDASGFVVANGTPGSVVDTSTKKITVTVGWDTPHPNSVVSTLLLTRFGNDVRTFSDEIVLGPGVGNGDWCSPDKSIIGAYDLTHNGVPIAITAATNASQDIAYTTTGNNASGYTVDHISITHDTSPTVGDTNFIGGPKGYGIATDGTYVYVNENNPPNSTVVIALASDLSVVGSFNVNKGTGSSVAVLGNTGYTTVDNTLYAFDVTQKTGVRPQKGSAVTLAGNGNKVVVVGTNAYVVTSNTTKQLQVINTTTMTVTKTINLGNNLAGVDVAVDPTERFAYVVTTFTGGKNDFFIVNLQSNTISGYSTNGMNPKGIIVPATNRAVLVGSGGELYQVFDITNPSGAFHCGGMSPAGVGSINAVAGIARDNGSVFSYIMTDNSSAEFQIIQGGPGGVSGKYAPTTTFESSTFDAGHNVAFNYFYVNADKPTSTSITYQLAIKSGIGAGVTKSCTGVTFSDGDFITIPPGPIPLSNTGYLNPGQCLRYRSILSTTDTNITPTLHSITINYSK